MSAIAAVLAALDTGVRGGPEPDRISLDNCGREIQEA
jgi:hypothetical protein